MQRKRTRPGEPDRWAITWVGEHANYPEFQLVWTTMASLTVVQYQALAEQWADTADRRLARGLALSSLAALRGNLAAVTIRFLDIFTLPLPPAELRDDDTRMLAWLPALATELPDARPAAALHDAMLASLAFPTISGDDDAGLREPWARVCLPCPFEPAAMFGDRKSTRLNSSHVRISYAVFCLKKKKKPYIMSHVSILCLMKNNPIM